MLERRTGNVKAVQAANGCYQKQILERTPTRSPYEGSTMAIAGSSGVLVAAPAKVTRGRKKSTKASAVKKSAKATPKAKATKTGSGQASSSSGSGGSGCCCDDGSQGIS